MARCFFGKASRMGAGLVKAPAPETDVGCVVSESYFRPRKERFLQHPLHKLAYLRFLRSAGSGHVEDFDVVGCDEFQQVGGG